MPLFKGTDQNVWRIAQKGHAYNLSSYTIGLMSYEPAPSALSDASFFFTGKIGTIF